MNDEQESESYRLVAWILGIAVTIAIAAAVIPGILGALGAAGPAPATSAASPAAVTAPSAPAAVASATAPAAAVNSAPAATAAVEAVVGPVKLYFVSGKTDLSDDAPALLKPVSDAIKAGQASKVAISGYHDKTGNPEQNAELAKNRAKAVRDELTRAGVTEAQIEMRKPIETEGSGDDREARRVEVSAFK